MNAGPAAVLPRPLGRLLTSFQPDVRAVRAGLLIWAAWTALALLFVLFVMLPGPAAGDPTEWLRAVAWQLVGWWSWFVCTPLVLAATRWAMTGRSRWRAGLRHGAAAVMVSGLCTVLQGALRWMVFAGVRVRYDIVGASSLPLADAWSFNLVVYGLVAGVLFAYRAERLEAQLARAQLEALTARLHPHFLFNTLNTISALVTEDSQAAHKMIARLSELLRGALGRCETEQVALEEELELLDHYAAIQQIRFPDRLRLAYHCDPGTARARVPPLLLQTLVENAIRHGVTGRDGSARVNVAVEAHRLPDCLRLVVRDDGPGFRAAGGSEAGVGLAATRARLAALYGAAHRLAFANVIEGGAAVTIEIPFQTCEP